MHNTIEENLKFRITWSETNRRYLLGANPVNEKLVAKITKHLAKLERQLLKYEN